MDPYAVLGVPRGATQEDIKRAYRRQARLWHPDVNPAPEAADKFKEIQLAHDTLTGKVKQPGVVGTPYASSGMFTANNGMFGYADFSFTTSIDAEQLRLLRESLLKSYPDLMADFYVRIDETWWQRVTRERRERKLRKEQLRAYKEAFGGLGGIFDRYL